MHYAEGVDGAIDRSCALALVFYNSTRDVYERGRKEIVAACRSLSESFSKSSISADSRMAEFDSLEERFKAAYVIPAL